MWRKSRNGSVSFTFPSSLVAQLSPVAPHRYASELQRHAQIDEAARTRTIPEQLTVVDHKLTIQRQRIAAHRTNITRQLEEATKAEVDISKAISACRQEVRAIHSLGNNIADAGDTVGPNLVENPPPTLMLSNL